MRQLRAIRFIPGTKISHDYHEKQVDTFDYADLIQRKIPAIGIPAKQNRLVIIDVDAGGDAHDYDGRPWWNAFSEKAGIPQTYTVQTRNGGYHYYFSIPASINLDTFTPPGILADGIEVKYNGWAAAPPTPGYIPVIGTPDDIIDAPPSLMMELTNRSRGVAPEKFSAENQETNLNFHKPFSLDQIKLLRNNLEWVQINAKLTRQEWRDGLFSLKAGLVDESILQEFVYKWTCNKSYMPGDEKVAQEMVERADRFGPIGPGTIFQIIKDLMIKQGAPMTACTLSREEIIEKSKVVMRIKKDGGLQVSPSESNVAALIGAMFDAATLFHDTRTDSFTYRGAAYSDTDLVNIITPMIQSPVYGLGFENIPKRTIASGLEVLMATRKIDPYKRWLETITWDGVPRVDEFFSTYTGVKNTQYHREVASSFWLSLAARGLNPGCQVDFMLIIEGAEGIRKSSLFKAIGGPYYMSLATNEAINTPEVLKKMHQHAVVELPELIGLERRSSNEIKAIITNQADDLRDLYSKRATKRARGFVMVGTTNNQKYLLRDMGVRRFMPVHISWAYNRKLIDTDMIVRDREQLFAEAVFRYQKGEMYWQAPVDIEKQVKSRLVQDPLVGPIADVMGGGFQSEWRMVDLYAALEARSYVSRGLTAALAGRIENALGLLGAEEAVTYAGDRCWKLPQRGVEDFI